MNEGDGARGAELAASWEENAEAWTAAVREGAIASRRAGTDAAILAAVRRSPPCRVLDVGCGEGWLARALAPDGYAVTGIDGSAALVERARDAGGGEFRVVSYEALIERPALAGGVFDVAVLNFAVLAEHVAPLLAAVRSSLAEGGRLLVQTVHPWSAMGDAPYANGWRVESFAAFGGRFPRSMPWYFRTLASWTSELSAAELVVERIEEPVDAATGRPLSLLLTAAPRR